MCGSSTYKLSALRPRKLQHVGALAEQKRVASCRSTPYQPVVLLGPSQPIHRRSADVHQLITLFFQHVARFLQLILPLAHAVQQQARQSLQIIPVEVKLAVLPFVLLKYCLSFG